MSPTDLLRVRVRPWVKGSWPLIATFLLTFLGHVSLRGDELHGTSPRGEMILVVGASGTDEYKEMFESWAQDWQQACRSGDIPCQTIGLTNNHVEDRSRLEQEIVRGAGGELRSGGPLWIVLIGHGTYDQEVAKFNLRGPDVSSSQMAQWLNSIERPLIVINCSSSSGPFLGDLKSPRPVSNRVVITATKSGAEINFARMGQYLAAAWNDPTADLDHDDQVSLLEAFLYGSGQVAKFYTEGSRLATEHALLDDNGDGKGTSADFFVGIRVDKESNDGTSPDGQVAHRYHLAVSRQGVEFSAAQLEERDRWEAALEVLRQRKGKMPEDEYFRELEAILVPLSRLMQR